MLCIWSPQCEASRLKGLAPSPHSLRLLNVFTFFVMRSAGRVQKFCPWMVIQRDPDGSGSMKENSQSFFGITGEGVKKNE